MADDAICSVDGCLKPASRRRLCQAHYTRWRRHGDPLSGRRTPTPAAISEAWLHQHATTQESRCLEWPFARYPNGYARGYLGGVDMPASRAMCIIAHGPPADPRLDAAHSCGNGAQACVNPQHLRWATRGDNLDDRWADGSMINGERAGTAKLSTQQVHEIRALRGVKSQRHLARDYGVSQTQISDIQLRRSWRWLQEEEGSQ